MIFTVKSTQTVVNAIIMQTIKPVLHTNHPEGLFPIECMLNN